MFTNCDPKRSNSRGLSLIYYLAWYPVRCTVPCTVYNTLYSAQYPVQCIVPYTVYNIVHKSLEWDDSSFCLLCLFVQIYLIPQKIARCLVSVIINAVFSNWNRIKDGIQLPLFLNFLKIVYIKLLNYKFNKYDWFKLMYLRTHMKVSITACSNGMISI